MVGTTDRPLHLAVALDGTGWHPASWRDPASAPDQVFTAPFWAAQARLAEHGRLDLLTIEDGLGLQTAKPGVPDDRTDQLRGRLDAVQIASFLAPVTRTIGLVPTATPTHTEPFHLASAFATLDHVSGGRAGWRPQLSSRPDEADLVGRRPVPAFDRRDPADPVAAAFTAERFAEAADAVEVVRRLWDSWEDDAIIKDVATGRFVDRDKLHYIDFVGPHFSVKGPSIVPRPPQGQPLVLALAHSRLPFEFAARGADVVCVTPADTADVARWIDGVRQAERTVGRAGPPLRILADLVVFLAPTVEQAARRKAALDAADGRPFRCESQVVATSPDELVELLLDWAAQGIEGFRLRPGVSAVDLPAIVEQVVPRLQAAGRFRSEAPAGTLRERFGLGRPASRYAPEVAGPAAAAAATDPTVAGARR